VDSHTTVDGCDLCEAAPLTTRYHQDDVCWIAECESCSVPMVVWRWHGAEPPDDAVAHMHTELRRVAEAELGEHYLDANMRQIPDHFHCHARRKWRMP
jgi:hypothetical protein